MGKKSRFLRSGVLGLGAAATLGVALRSGMFSKEAHGAVAPQLPTALQAPGALQLPAWNFSPQQPAVLGKNQAMQLLPANVKRRVPTFERSREPGVSFESLGAVVRSDELRMQLDHDAREGEQPSAFALRSLGTVRGRSVHEFAPTEATLANRHEVRIARGEGVTESLKAIPHGYEQSWTFDHAPEGDGDLQVAVGLDPAYHVVRTAEDGVVLENGSGARLSYGAAAWVDANGVRHDLRPQMSGNRVVITVPQSVVERSAYPAVLDPVVLNVAAVTEGYAPSVVGDASTGRYLGCWEDYTVFATPRIYCRLYTPSTNTTVASFRVSTGTSAQFEPVVERLSSGKFIVMWRDLRSGVSQIYYSTVNATTGAMYSADNRVTSAGAASTLAQYSPAVSCGVGNSAGSGSCIAVWGQINANSVSEVYQSRYDFNTTTGVVAATYYQGTVEEPANTPQAVDNYAPTVQLLDAASGAAFNAHVVWEKVVGANVRLRSSFVGRFPSNCLCTKDSVSVSGQPAGFITSEAGDQFSPSLTYLADTSAAPYNHGYLTYISTQTGTREVFLRSVEAFMGGGCTSVALPNSMSAATQLSSGGGAKDFASKLVCTGSGTGNACRLAFAVKNGVATSNVTTLITTSTTAPFYTVGASATLTSSASATMFNARLGSQINAGGNTGWLLLWDDQRNAGGYETYAARLNTAGASLDGTTGFKWSL